MKDFNEIKEIKARFEREEITADQIDKETQEAIAILMKQEIETNLAEIEKNEKEIDETRERIEHDREDLERLKADTEMYIKETAEYKKQIAKLKKNDNLNELMDDIKDEE